MGKGSTITLKKELRYKLLLPALFLLSAARLFSLSSNSLNPRAERGVNGVDSFLDGGAPPPPRREHFWEQDSSSCFHVDNICHGNDRWFYRRSGQMSSQPTITYFAGDVTRSHGYINVDNRIYFNVSSTSGSDHDDASCSLSPTPYHVVVQSAFNDMIGEFYSRTILPMNRWMAEYPTRSNDDVQLYVHFVPERSQLFEGHRLFLNGLPANEKVDNFLSLVQDDSCQCFKKLVFCGYNVLNETRSIVYNESNSHINKDENTTIFEPAGLVRNENIYCAMRTDGDELHRGNCRAYGKLRNDLLRRYYEKDPLLPEKIEQYRRKILLQNGFSNSTTLQVNEWKFVGLAVRKSRRKWLNVGDALDLCKQKFLKHKVACVAIDVEEADSPEKQLLMHHSLNALVGIHGAQLTQGVLLRKNSHILELLPWIPDYLYGKWTNTKHRPTPLGIIFHNTELNHVGYGLDRESVPLCLHVDRKDKELEEQCFMNKTNNMISKFQWATRDFDVPPQVVGDFISIFLLSDNSLCDDFRERAEEKDFVLYNVLCKDDSKQRLLNHHFYQE